MLSTYSAPHARETHAGRQCADWRKVNNRNNALYAHFTRTLHAKYIDKIHNSTLGGEINTIQTGWKTLTRCIRLRGPFGGPGVEGPQAPLDGYSMTEFPPSQYCLCISPMRPYLPGKMAVFPKFPNFFKLELTKI